ncbi:TetR/AcrR family transcriptional regulator [Nocardia sp. NPDC057227]|uniref:TetR/AcrR family transcriptional regulator n=1 Tax=Nocardia sp. NPDC057227 TaxID=3346056 RepID=UPI003643F751
MSPASRVNRGPAAAAENRAAILRAAREVFAHDGPRVPLSLISTAAGVGPAVLYRHFADRESLARALFDEDVAELEQLVAQPGCTLESLLDTIIGQTVECAGLLSTLQPDSPELAVTHRRMRELIDRKLADDGHGPFAPGVTADRLMLALALVAGLLTKTPHRQRPEVARDGWRLLLEGLS